MKSLLFAAFLALFAIAISSCDLFKKKPVDITVQLDNKPMAGIEVKSKYFSERTDDDGHIQVKLKRKAMKKQTTLSFKSKLFQVDTAVTTKLQPNNVFNVHGKTPAVVSMYGTLKDNKVDIAAFQDQLAAADAILKKLEKEVNDYMREHPESAMKDFLPLIENRTAELRVLEQAVENINKKYESAISQLPTGQFSDENFKELTDLFEKVEANMAEHTALVDDLAGSIDLNKENVPEIEYETNFFFKPGEYELGQLSPEQKEALDRFRRKIGSFVTRNYPNANAYKELVIKLKVTGYTDGIQVGDKLWDVIKKTNCSSKNQRGDGNNCLSELRAQSFANFIQEDYKLLKFETEVIGKGSEKAKPGEENFKLRKCIVSVTIFKASQKADNSVKYKL